MLIRISSSTHRPCVVTRRNNLCIIVRSEGMVLQSCLFERLWLRQRLAICHLARSVARFEKLLLRLSCALLGEQTWLRKLTTCVLHVLVRTSLCLTDSILIRLKCQLQFDSVLLGCLICHLCRYHLLSGHQIDLI